MFGYFTTVALVKYAALLLQRVQILCPFFVSGFSYRLTDFDHSDTSTSWNIIKVRSLFELEIKPCGFESRIRDMEAESYNGSHFLVNVYISFW